jgi:integrase
MATFGEAAREWLRYIEFDRKRRPSTLRGYRDAVRVHLLPEFGERTPLLDITHWRVDAFRQRLVEEEVLAPRTINKLLTNLHGIFQRAVRNHGVVQNPVALVDRQPCRSSGEFRVLAPAEVERLLHAAATTQDRAVFAVAAFAGLRMGELRALRWADVDFDLACIHVRGSYCQGRFDPPKSGRVRSVPLIPQAADPLQAIRFTCAGRPEELVFMSRLGRVIDDSRLRRRFYETLDRARLRPMRFHDLRHSFATLAVQAFPLTDVAAFMGHADISTTMIYIHHMPRLDAAARLAEVVVGRQ